MKFISLHINCYHVFTHSLRCRGKAIFRLWMKRNAYMLYVWSNIIAGILLITSAHSQMPYSWHFRLKFFVQMCVCVVAEKEEAIICICTNLQSTITDYVFYHVPILMILCTWLDQCVRDDRTDRIYAMSKTMSIHNQVKAILLLFPNTSNWM